MRIALFGGSFDPVHSEHVRLAVAAQRELGFDKLVFIPSRIAPHKALGAAEGGKVRFELLEAAVRGLDFAEVDPIELNARRTSYTYLTCRAFRERYPGAELFFLVGADMLENFFGWRFPEDILKNVTLVACGRGNADVCALRGRFLERFGTDFRELSFVGREISSTDVRVALAFRDRERAEADLPAPVLEEIERRKLYRLPRAERGLALLTPQRYAHSERVARMACARARGLGVPEKKALTAAMLHDCAKNLPENSPRLLDFRVEASVPPPVRHQYAGAYLAERYFGVRDEDVLSAIRYHTSGRENMSTLEKLIFLSDLLEEGRDFEGVEELRRVFYEDLDRCLFLALRHQLAYLRAKKEPVYPLTERAFEWIGTQMRFE